MKVVTADNLLLFFLYKCETATNILSLDTGKVRIKFVTQIAVIFFLKSKIQIVQTKWNENEK